MCHPWDGQRGILGPRRLCLTLALLAVVMSCPGVFPCPSGCRCTDGSGWVECRVSNLTQMPRGIPPLTQRLIVAGNTIPVLGEAAVVGNGSELLLLDTLDLQGNRIRRIAPGAFEGLSNLKTLNLSENALGSIASDAFRDLSLLHTLCMNRALHQLPAEQLWTALDPRHLPNLTQIQLVGNQLRNLPEDLPTSPKWEMLDLRDNLLGRVGERTTSWLQQHPSLKVYLSSNPFVCDCQLWPMYLWLKNTSQVGDKKKMTCHCPQPLNGTLLTQLTAEDFKCPEADAASYVFLGIVLALIGATFLMVLYLNRKGIKRWASNFREACRDQMEGYEYRYEHDPGPGVASVSAVV